jgi:hypothetical protein
MRLLPAIVAGMGILCASAALAHDSWINRGGYRSAAGELCCGEGDCFTVNGVTSSTVGYLLNETGELVPYSEALPSPDGAYWRCKRTDGSRRCFFAPPPNS